MNKVAKEDVPNFPRRACFQALMGRGRGGANRDLVGHTLTVSWGQRCGGNDFGQLLMPFGKDAVVQKCKLTLLMLSVDYSKLWMFHSLQIAYLTSDLWPLVLTLHFILLLLSLPQSPAWAEWPNVLRASVHFALLHICSFTHLYFVLLHIFVHFYKQITQNIWMHWNVQQIRLHSELMWVSYTHVLRPSVHICTFAHLHICTFVHWNVQRIRLHPELMWIAYTYTASPSLLL